MTQRLHDEAERLMGEIEAQGGVLRAIETGFIQRAIHRSACRYQQEIESGELGVIGVNRHTMEEEAPRPEFQLDPERVRGQIERLQRLRADRDPAAAAEALTHLERVAREGGNVMPPLYTCVKAYVTIGEMCDALRGIYGAYRDPGFL